MPATLAKLTSQSTQTLSLLLERQRLQTLPSFTAGQNSQHLPQIIKNLEQLRTGILELEAAEGRTESVGLLRSQYERMRSMIGDEAEVPSLDVPPEVAKAPSPEPEVFVPYTDDEQPGILLQTQREMMEEQDQRLDVLSQSIGRQHHISLQINDELDTHVGLLEELDQDLDRTGDRLGSARRRLDQVARGAKENASTVAIGLLIFVLLILIIRFKT